MLKLLSCEVDLARGHVHRGDVVTLTTREADLLRYFVAHPSQVVSRDELLAEVWGYSDAVVSRACDNTVRRLREKIEADVAHPDHVLTVHGVGYRFEPAIEAAPQEVVSDAAPAALVRLGTVTVDLTRRRVQGPRGPSTLTEVEASLLGALLEANGAVVERRELGRAGWGKAPAGARTLDAAIGKLRAKIEEDPADPQLLLLARGRGYRLQREVVAPEAQSALLGQAELLGRAALERHVCGLVSRAGWVLLLGPAGVGKSSLAKQIASRETGPVLWIDLASAQTIPDAVTIAARAQGIVLDRADDIDRIGTAMARQGAALVVLDNLEGLGGSARDFLARLRTLAPKMRWLGTSRVRVAAEDEVAVEVGPLSINDAVELFLRRAESASSLGRSLRGQPEQVEEIVTRLQCIPLAIVLAAARTPVLGLRELSERLSVDLLVAQGHLTRHISLRAAIEPSLRALPSAAFDALRVLSVLRSGFSIEDAEEILGEDAVDLVQVLRDHSLIYGNDRDRGERLRFETWSSVRELLDELPLPPAKIRQQLDWLGRMGHADVLPRHGHAALRDQTQRLYEQVDDVARGARVALSIGDTLRAARCAAAAVAAFAERGPYAEGVILADEVLAANPPGDLRAWLHLSRGGLHFILGDIDRAVEDYHQAAALAAEYGSPWVEGEALQKAAGTERLRGHPERMRPLLVRAIAAAAAHGGNDGQIEQFEAALAGVDGNTERQQELLRRGLGLALRAGDTPRVVKLLSKLEVIARIDGRLKEAHRRLAACDEHCNAAGLWRERANNLNRLLDLSLLTDDYDEADRLYPEALSLATRLGSSLGELDVRLSYAGSLCNRGEIDRARIELEGLDALLASTSRPEWAAEADLLRAEISLCEGDPSAARSAARRASGIYQTLQQPAVVAMAEGLVAMAAVFAGDRAAARQILADAPQPDRANLAAWLCQRALAAEDGAALFAEARAEAVRSGREVGLTDRELVETVLGRWASRLVAD